VTAEAGGRRILQGGASDASSEDEVGLRSLVLLFGADEVGSRLGREEARPAKTHGLDGGGEAIWLMCYRALGRFRIFRTHVAVLRRGEVNVGSCAARFRVSKADRQAIRAEARTKSLSGLQFGILLSLNNGQ
jgi:hypothetical protein